MHTYNARTHRQTPRIHKLEHERDFVVVRERVVELHQLRENKRSQRQWGAEEGMHDAYDVLVIGIRYAGDAHILCW